MDFKKENPKKNSAVALHSFVLCGTKDQEKLQKIYR
jgi:hypothetical protein